MTKDPNPTLCWIMHASQVQSSDHGPQSYTLLDHVAQMQSCLGCDLGMLQRDFPSVTLTNICELAM